MLDRLRDWALAIRARLGASVAIFLIGLPIIIVALALGAYGMWWRTLADSVRQNVVQFQSDQRSIRRDLSWDRFNVEGFPYRVEATILEPKFLAPDRGTAWNGDRVVMNVDPFAVGRMAVSLEGLHHVFYAKDGRWIEVSASAEKALINIAAGVFGPEKIALDFAVLTGKATVDDTDFNYIVKEATGGLTVTPSTEPDELPRVEFTARLKDVALQGDALEMPLGRTIQLIDIEAGAKFPTNVPQASGATILAEWRRTGTPIEIRRLELEWGGVTVSAKGEFKLDDEALPEGAFTITLANHLRVLELLRDYRWITPEIFAAAKPALDFLAFWSGAPQRRISVPLRIEGGIVFIGPARVASLRSEPTPLQLAPPGVPADVVVPEAQSAPPVTEADIKPAPPKPQPRAKRRARPKPAAPAQTPPPPLPAPVTPAPTPDD